MAQPKAQPKTKTKLKAKAKALRFEIDPDAASSVSFPVGLDWSLPDPFENVVWYELHPTLHRDLETGQTKRNNKEIVEEALRRGYTIKAKGSFNTIIDPSRPTLTPKRP